MSFSDHAARLLPPARFGCFAGAAGFGVARGFWVDIVPALSRSACSRSLCFEGAGAFFFGRARPSIFALTSSATDVS